jgi:hypothetical protein
MTDRRRRLWTPEWPRDVSAIIGGLHLGRGDPTFQHDPDGTIWRGIRTPQGASALCLGPIDGSGIEAIAWGPGAQWVLASVPSMLGDLDDATGFVAHHPQVAQAERRLRAIPGIGVWTAAAVRHTALGDPDAVSFGDYHVAKDIGWALTGSEVDDDGLAELLEPYAGHRYRVQGLLKLAGVGRPRHGPRLAARTHLPHRFR